MKISKWFVVVAFAAVCVLAMAAYAKPANDPCCEMDNLVVRSLTVQQPGSLYRATLTGQKDGVGLYIVGPDAPRGIIAHCDKDGSYIGLRGDRSDGTCDIALAVDRHDNNPRVQLVVDGKVTMISAKELKAIARSK